MFDDADRLFEMGFGEQLLEILICLPEMRQTLLFSATLPHHVSSNLLFLGCRVIKN